MPSLARGDLPRESYPEICSIKATVAGDEVPSNLLLVRYGARKWVARIMLTWGIIATAMMFVRTPMQFYVQRFLLGVAEAGFFPSIMYYLSVWYPGRCVRDS